ncbi:DUF7344 domain-containing protein [Natranaeroarchaeum sulfidigenes]|uniref:Putative trancriptional regulator, ArsR family n=1 Tax=Natranaeroarchaeum sulfidigenes TaxID=2784880 RepID=A0A897MTM5_9EURY|nr:hypothetical protein [Natranaeroarchaeum sulfidigenes]QSG03874.1 putative trancriptional regulator, ArsR family [Natranaeroarchaeum sulfidigenes]
MSTSSDTSGNTRNASIAQHDFSRDSVLEVLSNRRRRFAIHYLKRQHGFNGRHPEPVELSELAERIAGWEYDKPPERLTAQERKRVVNALRQFHLPKMDEYGFVEYDAQRGTIRLTEPAASADFYVDVLPERGIPWGSYHLGLAAVCGLCLVGIGLGVVPFTFFSMFAWNVFFVTVFGVSALGHYYDNHYRMRVGAREEPPEVAER